MFITTLVSWMFKYINIIMIITLSNIADIYIYIYIFQSTKYYSIMDWHNSMYKTL